MSEQQKNDERARAQGSGGDDASNNTDSQTGDPGRTPGAAEGDEQTIEEDLQQKTGSKQ
ncbi:MAG TPA: hypothetical protein VNA19_16445 [Pyrinomonadaceae bacterium]|nr:hypothetical protein [Pyrinomonadaceae bacterium]